jgi:hypothetical protein
MKTDVTVEKVETKSKYYPMYHLSFGDYRGETVIKLDERTARLLVTELDKEINFTQKIFEDEN